LPVVGPFVALRLHQLADLGVEHLVENRLQEVDKLPIAGDEALQHLLVERKLIDGHAPLEAASAVPASLPALALL
jgi:hypothetical protein